MQPKLAKPITFKEEWSQDPDIFRNGGQVWAFKGTCPDGVVRLSYRTWDNMPHHVKHHIMEINNHNKKEEEQQW